MLEVIQTGQLDKMDLIIEMHQLRKRVFKDRMGWNVDVTDEGLEIDQFDLPEAIYLLAINPHYRVVGNWRLLPSTGPTMLRDIWPEFLDDLPFPVSETVWEASRFAVESPEGQSEEGLAEVNLATRELFCGLTELCLHCGIHEIFTLYDLRIARLLRRLDCRPRATGKRLSIEGLPVEVGAFRTDTDMLDRLRGASGLNEPLIRPDQLPSILQRRYSDRQPMGHQAGEMQSLGA